MQDSLEDFLKIASNSKDFGANTKISKEQIITAERKKQCESYAQRIVEFMIEGKLETAIFLRGLNFINQELYQDIVDERVLTNLCGYALCGKKLPSMPNKQFHISTKLNKVYDITDRKNFCSNLCYKASGYIKNQIETSPLWLRNIKSMKTIQLFDKSNAILEPGEEIKQSIQKENNEDEFTSIFTFAHASLAEAEVNENKKQNNENKTLNNEKTQKLNTISEDAEKLYESVKSKESDTQRLKRPVDEVRTKQSKQDNDAKMQQILNNIKAKVKAERKLIVIENPNAQKQQSISKYAEKLVDKMKLPDEDENLQIVINKVKKMTIESTTKDPNDDKISQVVSKLKNKDYGIKKPILIQDVINPEEVLLESNAVGEFTKQSGTRLTAEEIQLINVTIQSWITLETLIYLHGDDKVRCVLSEDVLDKYFEQLKVSKLTREQQRRYVDICKRLQLKELAEEKFESGQLQPMPDYREIKQQSRDLNIKVNAFYSGVLYEKDDENFPNKNNSSEIEEGAILPLVDTASQHALRIKIFISSITNYIKKHTQAMSLCESVVEQTLDVARTLKLEAHNIVFKPNLWTTFSFVLINILSIKDENLRNELDRKSSIQYKKKLIFNLLGCNSDLIDDIFTHVSNVNEYIEKYITL